jgi:cation transport ATPase
MAFVQRSLPKLLISAIMILLILDYFIVVDPLRTFTNTLAKWSMIVIGISIGLALINVLNVHLRRINMYAKQQGADWKDASTSIILLICMFAMLLTGFTTTPFGQNELYKWMVAWLYIPLDLTTFSLLGFFYFSALYRGWKLRSLDMLFMIVPGMLQALSITPIWLQNPTITWIRLTFRTWHWIPAWNALTIIVTVGLLAVAMRTLMGREEAYLGLER